MTDTISFWRGEFGDAYTERNAEHPSLLQARIDLWFEILAGIPPLRSILEVGANIGTNLFALKAVTTAELYAVEPNKAARTKLTERFIAKQVEDGTADDLPFADDFVDLAFTCGVLIHVAPEQLLASCREIHRVAARYIACVEYFSQEPEEKLYRGHEGKLWKRDFGGYWLDHFPDLEPIGCGFAWKRTTGLDNLTWWMLEKRG